jgi:hypothetical protein
VTLTCRAQGPSLTALDGGALPAVRYGELRLTHASRRSRRVAVAVRLAVPRPTPRKRTARQVMRVSISVGGAAEFPHPTGRERMGSLTPQTLQETILLLPGPDFEWRLSCAAGIMMMRARRLWLI